jgi:hypothetical protein
MNARNRGFSLLEFLVATSFFCIILLAGYEVLDSQQFLLSQMEIRTSADQKSNYRILVLRNLLQDAAAGFQQDGLTEGIPYFFSDLNFGRSEKPASFSVALPRAGPRHFATDPFSGLIQTEPASELKPSTIVALGGQCGDDFCWNYGRITSTIPAYGMLQLHLDFLVPGEIPSAGALILVELHGFQFANNTLYWISPAGQAEPFWPSLSDFHYEYSSRLLTLSWKTGQTNGRSVIGL